MKIRPQNVIERIMYIETYKTGFREILGSLKSFLGHCVQIRWYLSISYQSIVFRVYESFSVNIAKNYVRMSSY